MANLTKQSTDGIKLEATVKELDGRSNNHVATVIITDEDGKQAAVHFAVTCYCGKVIARMTGVRRNSDMVRELNVPFLKYPIRK
jgi:hypothetical protein